MTAEVTLPTVNECLADKFVEMVITEAVRAGLSQKDIALALLSKGAALLVVYEGRAEAAKTLRGAADHVERPLN